MCDIYKISVDGNNLILFSEDYIKRCVFIARLSTWFSGKLIKIDQVRHCNAIDLHEFLHDFKHDEDYVLLNEKIQAFGTSFFESFLDSFLNENDEFYFIDYVQRKDTEKFLIKVEEYEDHFVQEGD